MSFCYGAQSLLKAIKPQNEFEAVNCAIGFAKGKEREKDHG